MIEVNLKSLLDCAGAVSLVYIAAYWLFAEELEGKLHDRFPRNKKGFIK